MSVTSMSCGFSGMLELLNPTEALPLPPKPTYARPAAIQAQ
jgi:hypothetical protein